METHLLTRLFPSPEATVALKGLYLQHTLQHLNPHQQFLVYSNFIASLDGRIAVSLPDTGKHGIPNSLTNPRDWRLYQELATQADILLTSARYIRGLARNGLQKLPISDDPSFSDLFSWREERGMPIQPPVVILSASLKLPIHILCEKLKRPIYIATGAKADPEKVDEIKNCGAHILFAGKDKSVDASLLIHTLVAEGFHNIYSIAGPTVLKTLITAGVLNRLYLTQVHRLLGGTSYYSLLEGPLLSPPADFVLNALYYDRCIGQSQGQFFSIYDAVTT